VFTVRSGILGGYITYSGVKFVMRRTGCSLDYFGGADYIVRDHPASAGVHKCSWLCSWLGGL
jgi:hypothetical protein